jgi:RNA-directed DNA polymerase
MGTMRQKTQLELAFSEDSKGEARRASEGGTEVSMASRRDEGPAGSEGLMEEVVSGENVKKALERVQRNRGCPGVDGMSVSELADHLRDHWPGIRAQLLSGEYRPQPVQRVEIPKPGGGARELGVPTVVDRLIQQAILQVLQPRWDPTFSEHSYGFRPGRSAHQAVAEAQQYVAEGYAWVVDLDLEKFFDRVNHDQLMARVAERVGDKRLLKLLRAFLNAGVMEDGLVSPTPEGTPQGGPLSPLLSNLVLDALDRELERRGHRFVRYADDCNVYVKSERAGHRVMKSVMRFVEKKLKLKVNRAKSAVARPSQRSFLGFGFTDGDEPRRRIAPSARARFKKRVRELTRRNRSAGLEQRIVVLSRYLRGWIQYYGFCETPSVLGHLDSWTRRRLRSCVWKQWRNGRRRFAELRRRDVGCDLAAKTAGSLHGPWRLSRSPALSFAFPNAVFDSLGLLRLDPRCRAQAHRTAVYGPVRTVV